MGGDLENTVRGRVANRHARTHVLGAKLGDDGRSGRVLIAQRPGETGAGAEFVQQLGREAAVLGAQHESCGYLRPTSQRPRPFHGRLGRVDPLPAQRLFGERPGYVVVEADVGVVVSGQPTVAGSLLPYRVLITHVCPPVPGPLAGRRDHPGHQHQQVGSEPIGHQQRGERAK